MYLTALRNAQIGEVVVFDEQSPLTTVIESVKHARAIVGMHGSTLAPMIWAPKGVAVVEILHSIPWLHWWATATALKHDYWLVPVDSAQHDSATVVAPVALTVRTVRAAFGLPDLVAETASVSSEETKEEVKASEEHADAEKEKEWREDVTTNDKGWKEKEEAMTKETETKEEVEEETPKQEQIEQAQPTNQN
jgi:Glycosyltransferase 61